VIEITWFFTSNQNQENNKNNLVPTLCLEQKMLIFRIMAAVLLIGVTTVASAETFVWDAKKAGGAKAIPGAILANNVIIEEDGSKELFDHSITAFSIDNKQKKTIVKNDIASISASYPTVRKASVVVLADSCSGTICHWTNITVLIPDGNFVKTYAIDNPSKITLTIVNGELISGRAEGVPAGQDEFGSDRHATLIFVPYAGFVPPNFKREYAKLIGEHPDKFFSDEILRKPLAKVLGLDKFRDLRHAIGVASPTALIQNRYIVMQGCIPHNCGGNYGFLMIDAVTSNIFWARFDESKASYFGGTSEVDKLTMQSALDSDDIFQYSDAKLSVTNTGKITYKPK
jgi:hypothetical protein